MNLKYGHWGYSEDVIKKLSDTAAAVLDTAEDDLIGFHLNWGIHIRNTYNLWQNPKLVKALGADDPDGASVIIIKAVWQALQAERES